VFHNKARVGEESWGPRVKICHESRATLIRPWSLVGSSCGFNANCQRSKESTDDFPRRRITGAAQASSVKYGAPVNHNYPPPPSVDKLFIPLQICICRPSLSWGRGKNCSLCPPPPAWAALAPPLSYYNYLLQIIFKALVFFK
jgi:hypothetical protein